jgi:cytochrome c1
MKSDKKHRRMSHDWYLESKKKHNREKFCFYILVFIAIIMFVFAVYIFIRD